MRKFIYIALTIASCTMVLILPPVQDAFSLSDAYKNNIYQIGPPEADRYEVEGQGW